MGDDENEPKIPNPNFKFREIITKNNCCTGINDIFDIYTLRQNNETYLASPDKTEYNLNIIEIKTNKLFLTLKSHNYFINMVKYFYNELNNDEYLISIEKSNIILIWEIKENKYAQIYRIDGQISKGYISGFLFIFNNINKTDIIFSYNCKECTNIYSLDKKTKIKLIESTNKYDTNYIIIWPKNFHLIELSNKNIYIYDIENNELYASFNLGIFDKSKFNCGFVYQYKKNDYLIVCASNGNIIMYNLDEKNLFRVINIYNNINIQNNIQYVSYIIKWSKKYLIVFEYHNKGYHVIDIETFKIITKIRNTEAIGSIICAKKFNHHIYGYSLLIANQKNEISLWTVSN